MPPLSWQGWVERPLKAWGSSSDLTTVSPSTKLVGVCLDKWTWQPPTMRSPCRLTTPQAYHLAQPRVYVCRDFSISIRLLQVFSCLRMSPLSRQERALTSDDSAVSDAKARRGRAFYRFLLKQNDPPLFALTRAYEQSNERGERHRALDQDRSSGALLNVKEYSLCVLSVSQLSSLHIWGSFFTFMQSRYDSWDVFLCENEKGDAVVDTALIQASFNHGLDNQGLFFCS